ncbi:MAG TPA: helix-turn-helix domain-containing protein, partial [Acidimicrobiales bacterium]|nr:helix-turn-helix domain-containing protein [Acidimicrobiales bacterium]
MAEATLTKVGRPRDPHVDKAILSAALDLLIEDGFPRLSIEGVAARAGVGKAAIYRRWDSKTSLVVDAINERV